MKARDAKAKDGSGSTPGLGRRIMVVGPSGSGKTTVSREIGRRLGLRVVELDALYHLPNWQETPRGEFRSKVMHAFTDAPDGWVCDGNYTARVMDLVLERADTMVWLRLPFRVVFPRLVMRTLIRGLRKEMLWATNRESLRMGFLSKDSVICFMVRTWRHHPRSVDTILAEARRRPRMIVLRSPGQVRRFLDSIVDSEDKGFASLPR